MKIVIDIQYPSATRYKARVITRVCTQRQTHLYTEANTCLYIVKWVYTRRQMRLHEKTNVFALYLVADEYCTCITLIFSHTKINYLFFFLQVLSVFEAPQNFVGNLSRISQKYISKVCKSNSYLMNYS